MLAPKNDLRVNVIISFTFRIVKDGQWGWRALRLLAKKSPYFFTYGNNPIARLPDYLDSMLKKMSNFTPSTPNNASANGTNGTKEVGKTEASADLCTKENLSKIASNLGEEWPKLLPKLGLSQEDGEKFTKDGKTSQGKFIVYQIRKLFLCQSRPKLYVQIYDLSKRNSFDFFSAPQTSKNSCLMHIFPMKNF